MSKLKRGVWGLPYALWRCAWERSPIPLVDYAESQSRFLKHLAKYRSGFLGLVLIIIGFSYWVGHEMGWKKGYRRSEASRADEKVREMKPLPPLAREQEYQTKFRENRGDGGELNRWSLCAFYLADYNWCAKFMEAADTYAAGDDTVRMGYPYWGVSLILLNRPAEGRQKFKDMINIVNDNIAGKKYLGTLDGMGGVAYFFRDSRKRLPASEQKYIDAALDELDGCIAKVKAKP